MRKFLAVSLLSLFALLTFSVGGVSAKVMSSEKGNVTVAKGEVIDDDLFIGAETATIDGTVNGDVFVGAQVVTISGVINGNLHVGANTVDLRGNIKGNVYAGGQSVILSGAKVGGSVLGGGATVSLDKDSTVGGSVLVGAGSLSVNSQIKRSIYAAAGSINLGENTKVGKDFYYSSDPDQTTISEGAKISGNTYKADAKTSKEFDATMKGEQVASFMSKFNVTTKVISLLGALVVGFLYFKLFGKRFEESSETVSENLWKSLGIGFLVIVGLIPGLIILLLTIVGAPVAGLAFLLFMLYSYLAKIVVGLAFGVWLSKKFSWKLSTYAMFAVGLFAIYVLKMVPVVGGFVTVFVYLAGLGALTLQTLSIKK